MTQLRVHAPAETANQLDRLRTLADRGVAADQNEPFGDQTWVELNSGNAWLITTGDDELTGASAVVIPTDANQPVVIELVVAPEARGGGLGRALVDATQELLSQQAADEQTVTAWTHGDHPAARHLAASADVEPVRILYRMAIDITSKSFGDATVPDGYRIRTFNPGDDDAAWLELNAMAFADHPEQGQLTQADLDARKAEDWFDPAGFFIAENAEGAPAGFHWTKTPVGSAAGEVYAVGVHPNTQGTGLGKALTLHGMNYLAASGLEKIVLYVDDENRPAVNLYNALGFGVENTDVMFSSNS
ncbi:mycothiol synthase [Yaniella flava]|uniref:Mycothiol acetyltransferase n=1 Tax=Yaniella flava TaxID=287930 RepID=A0ABP5FRX3_9MICC